MDISPQYLCVDEAHTAVHRVTHARMHRAHDALRVLVAAAGHGGLEDCALVGAVRARRRAVPVAAGADEAALEGARRRRSGG